MNRFEELQTRIADQGKSVLDYTVDWIEWSARKNLDIAEDVAEFTVGQLRLPVEAGSFSDYRHNLRDAYSEFGDTLKRHSDDYVGKLKNVPAEVRDIFAPRKAVKTTAAAPKAKKAKAAPAKKAATAKSKAAA